MEWNTTAIRLPATLEDVLAPPFSRLKSIVCRSHAHREKVEHRGEDGAVERREGAVNERREPDEDDRDYEVEEVRVKRRALPLADVAELEGRKSVEGLREHVPRYGDYAEGSMATTHSIQPRPIISLSAIMFVTPMAASRS